MTRLRIPPRLLETDPGDPHRRAWIEALPGLAADVAARWELELAQAYQPGGCAALAIAATGPGGEPLVLKLGWRHDEGDHEADGLRVRDGDGAVRCHRHEMCERTSALLLERCVGRVRAWLLARAAQESCHDRRLRAVSSTLAAR